MLRSSSRRRQGSGRAPGMVGFQRPHLGQRVEQRQRLGARSRRVSWKAWKLPGDSPRTYAVYVDDKDKVWLTDFSANAIVRFDPLTEKFNSFPERPAGRECAADGRQARRNMGRRIRHQPAGGDPDRRAGVRFFASLLLPVMLTAAPAAAEQDGARLFAPCRACHSLDPAERGLPGPNLARPDRTQDRRRCGVRLFTRAAQGAR